MKLIHEETMRVNSGSAWVVKKGQRIRINFESIMDFVVFNREDLHDRFDQARTKSNQGKVFISKDDLLYSKLNTILMTIVEDTYKGRHDLQYGMCSKLSFDEWWRKREQLPFREWFAAKGVKSRDDLPAWGCYENLSAALSRYPILPLDIPAPFNIAQSEDIDPKTGRLIPTWRDRDIPDPGTHIDLRAEVDCLCAGSCAPGQGKMGYAKPITVQIFQD
jgi:uncharacterized protein